MEGWIKLHRSVMENELYFAERFTKMQAWIDLLILATHKQQTLFLKGVEIQLQRGQLAYSIVSLALRWKWNERTVNKFLSMLEKREMIQSRKSNITTVITVRNYNHYQEHTERSAEQIQSEVQTNKNDKNEKKSVVTDNGDFEKFLFQLKSFVEEKKIPCNIRNLNYRLEKPFLKYGQERINLAFGQASINWQRNGHTEGDFINYALKILREDYVPIQYRTH